MSVTITQGDYIYYQDTSTGGPTSRQWSFPGGTPTGATATNPLIQYLSPSTPGFDATLTAIKALPGGSNLTSTKTEANIIKVNSENLSVTLTATPSTSRMSSPIVYGASGPTGNVAYYSWSLAGTAGFTGTNNNQSLNIYSWLALTGSELGATYDSYTTASSVTATSMLSNTATSSVNVTYTKNGPAENYNYNDDQYTPNTGYYTASIVSGVTTNALSMSGSGYVISVDTKLPDGSYPIDNQYFRAHSELLVFRSPSMDILYSSQYGYIPGQFIASLFPFQVLGVSQNGWENETRYTLGNYMFPGDISTYFDFVFYFADVLNVVRDLSGNRSWSTSQMESIFNDYSVASQSSRALEVLGTSIKPAAFNLNLDGSANTGPGGACLPSGQRAGGDVILTLTIEFGNSISTIVPAWNVDIGVTISSGGQPGNSDNGELVFAEDYGTGPNPSGIATLINDQLTTAGYDAYIQAEASPDYAWLKGAGLYNTNQFQGLKISIINRGPTGPNSAYIARVTVLDNGPWAPDFTYSAFPASPGQSSWLAFNTNYVANPWQVNNTTDPVPRMGWYFGIQ